MKQQKKQQLIKKIINSKIKTAKSSRNAALSFSISASNDERYEGGPYRPHSTCF